MPTIETGNNVVYWSDIEAHVAAGKTNQEMADICNADWRHFGDTTVNSMFDLLFAELEMIQKNLGVAADPDQDSGNWRGIFDQYHRDLADTGNVNKLLKKAWNRSLTYMAVDAPRPIPTVPPYPPQEVAVEDKYQKSGLSLTKWDEISQDLTIDPGYVGGPYENDAQGVHDLWIALTGGGRRFGIVTAADIQAVIDQRNTDTGRQSAQQTAQEATTRANVAVQAANAAYANGDSDTQIRAAYKSAWDSWPEPVLPYPPLN